MATPISMRIFSAELLAAGSGFKRWETANADSSVLNRDPRGALALLPKLFRLVEMRHAGTGDVWATAAGQQMLTDYVTSARPRQMLAMVILLDGEPIGFNLGFVWDGTLIPYVTVMHPAFRRFRIGHLSFYWPNEEGPNIGLETVDVSKCDYFAKRVWANETRYSALHIATRSVSPLAWVSLLVRAALSRLRVWSRDGGLSATIKSFLRQRNATEGAPWSVPAAAQPPDVASTAFAPLRSRHFFHLPVPQQTAIADFVFEHRPKGPVLFIRQGDAISLQISIEHTIVGV